MTLYEQALQAGSRDGFVLGNLGAALMAENRNAEAVPKLREAAQVEPAYAQHWRNLTWALLRVGRIDEAWRASDEWLRLASAEAGGLYAQARLAFAQRDIRRASNALAQAVERGWDRLQAAKLAHDAGVTLAREGRLAEALFRRSVEWQPEMVEGHRDLIHALLDQGNRQAAREALTQAVDRLGPRGELASAAARVDPTPAAGHSPHY